MTSALPVKGPAQTPGTRLNALDLLRGLDIFFLTVVAPLFWAVHRVWGLPGWATRQMTHVEWEGLHAWDLVMPWFIFMCGAAIPFALAKRLRDGRPTGAFWRHVFGRVLLLWVLGMLVQGELLSLDPARISLYNNTLQAIASGYVIAALAFLVPSKLFHALLPWVLAALYTVLLALFGDYTPTGNFAIAVDRILLPGNRDGYGWVLTSLMFGTMTLCGAQCATFLRGASSPIRKVLTLGGAGAILLVAGVVATAWIPAIKRIYTLSFTLQALGLGVLALALFYLVFDVLNVRLGTGLLRLFGQHALTAYLCSTLFAPAIVAFANIFVQGVPHLLGAPVQPFVLALANALVLVGIVWLHARLRQAGGGR